MQLLLEIFTKLQDNYRIIVKVILSSLVITLVGFLSCRKLERKIIIVEII